MPPKVKITREEIVGSAVSIVREGGTSSLNARTVAAALNCSTQPVFSNFSTMEELHAAVLEQAEQLCEEYMHREVTGGQFPPYKAVGMAYIRFAKEEKELFKLLYMRDRTGEDETGGSNSFDRMVEIIRENTGLSNEDAAMFHLEMWAYVHGVATMFATGYLNLEWELVSRMLTDSYHGLRKQYGLE